MTEWVVSETVSAVDLSNWVRRLVWRWPQVTDVALVGSRARGNASAHSDYDVVVCLGDDCYEDEETSQGLEQRIAYDPDLAFAGLDLFFLRPNGTLGRWAWGPGEEPPCVAPDDPDADYINAAIRRGELLGDFSRLYRSLPQARRLYGVTDPPAAVQSIAGQKGEATSL